MLTYAGGGGGGGGGLSNPLAAGTVSANSIQIVQAGTGLYQPATNVLGIAANGIDVIQANTVASGINFLSVTPGAAGNPVLLQSAAVASTGGISVIAAAPPATTGASQVGKPVAVTASAAIASSDTAGAAAGGAVTITGGAAARLTSGNANGGAINLTPGAGIGTGLTGAIVANGQVQIPLASSLAGLKLGAGVLIYENTNSGQLTINAGGASPAMDVIDAGGGQARMRWYGAGGISLTGTASSSKTLGDGVTLFTYEGGNGHKWYSEGTAGASHFVGIDQGDFASISRGVRVYRSVHVRTADYTVLEADTRKCFTNTGATALVTFTLPASQVGREYQFFCDDTDGLEILAPASGTIQIGATTSASAGFIKSVVPGSAVTLVNLATNRWVATNFIGTFTVDI